MTIPQSTLGYQSTGNTTTNRQHVNGPLPKPTTTLPWSRLGYQSNGNNNGTRQQVNGTSQNNVPMAPPSYRTTSRTPSLTLPQSALGKQSNTTGQTRQTDTYTQNIATGSIVWNPMETTRNTDTYTQNTSNSFVAKAPMETTRIMANKTQKLDTTAQSTAQPTEFVTISFVTKEIWLEFDIITCQGMITEKALIDSRANENCLDIKIAHKLGIKPRLLPKPMGLRNVNGTDNRGG